MAATLRNLPGFTFEIPFDETGINIESITIDATEKNLKVPNKGGETRGRVDYDPYQDITISGETTATPTAILGQAITVANLISLGGVSAGAVILTQATLEHTREQLRKLTQRAERYPLIP